MQINPESISQVEGYKLLIGGIVPRPIGFVSTISPQGAHNLAPFSFFNGVCSNPLTLLFCPSNKPDGSGKDTLRNVEATGQFVVNIVSEAIARQMSIAAEDLPYGQSEFEFAGLTPAASVKVKPPRVSEAPLSYECELTEIVRINPGAAGGGNVVIGQVVWIHAADGLVDERYRVDPARLAAVGRMAGLTYCRTRDRFDLPWGRDALEG